MDVKTKRIMASWVLLAVFVPMVLLSSFHVHESNNLFDDNCNECVQHHCNGHLGELTTTIHACVICQFQTFSFVAAAIFAVVLFSNVSKNHIVRLQSEVHFDVCGIPTLRAPPFV